ncbi:MAG: hypothetical protein EOP49_38145, partial [Sphingobacteriales bacterium]
FKVNAIVGNGGGGVSLGETSTTAFRGDRGKIAYDHSLASGNPHGTTKAQVGLGNAENTSDADKPVSVATQAALDSKADLVGGKVPASQLPGAVDEIIEFADQASFPATGDSNSYYLALDTNKTYRWSGSVYVPINEGLALGETSSTAYRGDRGKTAYDHSQATGNPHGLSKSDIGLSNVDNTADSSKPVSTAQQAALDGKADKSQLEAVATSGTATLDFSVSSFNKITQTGSIDFAGSNTSGTKKIVKTFLIQGSTNPAHTITFPSTWKNLSGVSADSTKMNYIELVLINGAIQYSLNKFDIPDSVAPTLLRKSILLESLNTIELTYDEALNSAITMQNSWFTVAGKTVTGVSIIANRVRVTVSVAFAETDSPLVTFTNQPSGDGIQDASGNKAPNFSQNIGLVTYRFDNFNRADSTSSINSPSDGGSNWTVPFGAAWGINGNKAYCAGADTSTNQA